MSRQSQIGKAKPEVYAGSDLASRAGILAAFCWVGGCLIAIRQSWLQAPGYGSGLAWQMLAGLPVAAWFAALMSGKLREWGRGEIWLLIAAGVLLRFVLIDLPPAQSDDLYRYIWEGRIQWAGYNPFAYAPDHPRLTDLRDELWPLINNRELSAIYPPLAQWTFMVAAWMGGLIEAPVAAMKAVFTLCEIAAFIAMVFFLRSLGRHPAWAALWIFHPLAIVEFSGNGHLDSLMALTLLLALWLLHLAAHRQGRKADYFAAGAALALAASILSKVIPVLLAPFFLWRLGRRWPWLILAAALCLLAYVPFFDAGWSGLASSAGRYASAWEGNAPAFVLVRSALGGMESNLAARYAVAAGLVLLIAALWARRLGPLEAAPWVLGSYLALNPVVHPWYAPIVWLAVLARLRWGAAPWLWLTLTLPLSYLGYAEHPPVWPGWVIWAPFWTMLIGWGGWKATRFFRPGN